MKPRFEGEIGRNFNRNINKRSFFLRSERDLVNQKLALDIVLKTIQWTYDSQPPSLDDVSIDHSGFYAFVTKKLLDCANIITSFKQVGGIGSKRESIYT